MWAFVRYATRCSIVVNDRSPHTDRRTKGGVGRRRPDWCIRAFHTLCAVRTSSQWSRSARRKTSFLPKHATRIRRNARASSQSLRMEMLRYAAASAMFMLTGGLRRMTSASASVSFFNVRWWTLALLRWSTHGTARRWFGASPSGATAQRRKRCVIHMCRVIADFTSAYTAWWRP